MDVVPSDSVGWCRGASRRDSGAERKDRQTANLWVSKCILWLPVEKHNVQTHCLLCLLCWSELDSLRRSQTTVATNTAEKHRDILWKLEFPHQKLVLVFGLEHGGHLLQVQTVPLLLQLRGEEDRNDPLCDVGQVEVVVALHHPLHHSVHAETPEKRRDVFIKRDAANWLSSEERGGAASTLAGCSSVWCTSEIWWTPVEQNRSTNKTDAFKPDLPPPSNIRPPRHFQSAFSLYHCLVGRFPLNYLNMLKIPGGFICSIGRTVRDVMWYLFLFIWAASFYWSRVWHFSLFDLFNSWCIKSSSLKPQTRFPQQF